MGDADDGCGCDTEAGGRESEMITRRAFASFVSHMARCCLLLESSISGSELTATIAFRWTI
jgi:hypothetical protein